MKRFAIYACAIAVIGVPLACRHLKPEESAPRNPAVRQIPGRPDIEANAERLLDEGRQVFRHDTFGSEDYWGGKLRLHEAISGAERHGVGPGLTPHQALQLAAAERGRLVFEGRAQCAVCHVPPLFTEPGWPMHTAEEMGIADFHARRSPDKKFYRTTPLRGLFVRAKGGFYHDGRFADLDAVVAHYERLLRLQLSAQERADLIQYLKSL